jgi:RNA polymerase sigma-70 factor, ECF subfamily
MLFPETSKFSGEGARFVVCPAIGNKAIGNNNGSGAVLSVTMAISPSDSLEELHARFNILVLPHLDRLLGFARRRTEDAGDAEDSVQEACVRAWLAFGDLRDDSLARPWLYRILRSVLSDSYEKNGRRRQLVSISRLEDVHEELVATDGEFVFAEVAARIDGETLRVALATIPEDFAGPVELHDIDGFKYNEIAEILGVPIGTVMSRISRGRRLLAGTIANNRAALAQAEAAARSARPKRVNDRGAA